MSSKQSIIRNTAYLSSAFIAQKILSFTYFTLIARLVGVVDTGAYVFALSYSTIFSVLIDFGLAPSIQREIAQHPDQTKTIVQHTLRIKTYYALATVALGVVISHFMPLDPLVQRMIFIALALMVVDSYNLTLWSAFRGHHQLKYEAASVVMGQLMVFLVGLGGLLMGASISILVTALLLGSVLIGVYATALVRLRLGFWAVPSFQYAYKKEGFLRESFSFGMAGAFSRVFSSIDSVMLNLMAGSAAVGFYSVPNKIVFALQFIPSAFSAAIYPAMSHYYQRDTEKMVEIFERAMLFLLLLAVPTAIGICTLANPIISELYTREFSASIPAMYILVWGVIFGFVEWPLGSLLSAMGLQKKNTITRGTVMVVNIILNLLLIPFFSYLGASIAALASYALMAVMGIYWVRSAAKVDWRSLRFAFFRICLSAIFMGALILLLRPYIHFALLVPFGAIIYGFGVIILRVVTIADFRSFIASFRKQPVETV